jgi:nucleotide-binding universal stress UspA family protein
VGSLLARPLVPVADDEDARVSAEALAPYLEGPTTVLVAHVIEKAGGAVDKASVEQREGAATEAFDAFVSVMEDADVPVTVETEMRYDTDIVAGVFGAADDTDASAVAFVPHEGGRLLSLLTGNRTRRLVTEGDLPVVSLPGPTVDGDEADR